MKPKQKFWNFARNETTGERELHINGAISDEVWWGDECTPSNFRAELFSGNGDITVWINSHGGSVFAASEIYTMLSAEYKGKVTAKIPAICASAASVIAMSADTVLMSPTAYMLIHNPSTIAIGDSEEMRRVAVDLDKVKEGIINAYEKRTGLSREQLNLLMNKAELIPSNEAIEHGLADGYIEKSEPVTEPITGKFEKQIVNQTEPITEPVVDENKTTIESCYARLKLFNGGIFPPCN